MFKSPTEGNILIRVTNVSCSPNQQLSRMIYSFSATGTQIAETTVEGYYTLESVYQLLKNKEVTIPIIDLIYEIAVQGKDPELLLSFLVFKS